MTKQRIFPTARLNLILRGKPAEILLKLKKNGIARSNADAVSQALLALHERILDVDLKEAKLKTFEEAGNRSRY